ncbi:hypothetical protein BH10ACT3_BH10ACT3_10320 [soil metagenome]
MAAVGVVVTHVAFVTGVVNPERWSSPLRQLLPRLDVGVSIFFVLSGLLVTRPFIRSLLADGPSPDVRRYAARRLSRIYPLYWVVLAVTLLMAVGPGPSVIQVVSDFLLLHIYRPATAIGPITQSWSLATEVAFYAFVPLWFWLCRRFFERRGTTDRRTRIRLLAVGLVGWVVVALLWRLGVVAATSTYDISVVDSIDTRGALLTWLPNQLDEFAVGTALALWLESGAARRLAVPARLACYLGAAAALWTASAYLDLPPIFTGFDGPQTLARHALFVVCAGLLVLPSAAALSPARVGSAAAAPTTAAGATTRTAFGEGVAVGGFSVARVVQGAALASYGVYLWHQLVTTEWFSRRGLTDFVTPFPTTIAAVVAISFVLAGLTYWSVEKPAAELTLGSPLWTKGTSSTDRPLGRHRGLDGVRGLAVLAVLATHVVFLDNGNDRWSLHGGFLGVDFFLVLSGFLIGSVLLGEVGRTGSIDGATFARRRGRRLLPTLIVVLVIQGVVAVALGSEIRRQLIQAILALTFTSNWQLSFGGQPPFDLVHLWSLSREGQFYALLALLVWSVRKRVEWARPVALVLVLAAVAIAVWRLFLYQRGVDPIALYERTGARFDSALLGLAAALVWRARLVGERALRIAGIVGMVVLAVAAVTTDAAAPWLFEGGFTVIAAAAAAVVLAVVSGSGLTLAIADLWIFRWFGMISYSLYLWHLPVYLWVVRAIPDAPIGLKMLIAFSAATGVAVLSFHLVEARTLASWRRKEGART